MSVINLLQLILIVKYAYPLIYNSPDFINK